MANRYATKSGVWSDTSVWDGGSSLPGAGDVVRPNNYTVTIDQDVTVAELRNDASSPAVAGGGFVVSSVASTLTITATLVAGGASLLTISATSGTVAVVGDIPQTSPVGASKGLVVSGNANVTVTGNVSGGVAAGSNGIYISGAAAVTINGNVAGGAGGNGVQVAGSATVDIQGTITATAGGHGAYLVGATVVRVKGRLVNHQASHRSALVATHFAVNSGENIEWVVQDDSSYPNGANVSLTNYVADSPPPADVREGTVYGPSSNLTGTLAVPDPEQVASGAAVDDTVGTAALLLADVAAVTGAQIAEAVTA